MPFNVVRDGAGRVLVDVARRQASGNGSSTTSSLMTPSSQSSSSFTTPTRPTENSSSTPSTTTPTVSISLGTTSSSTPTPSNTLASISSASLASLSSLASVSSVSTQSLASLSTSLSLSLSASQNASSIAAQSTLSLASLASVASVSSVSTASTASRASQSGVSSSVLLSTVFVTNGQTTTATVVVPTSVQQNRSSSTNAGAIAGGVVGGVVGLGLVFLLIFCLYRRKKTNEFDGNWDPDRDLERPATLPQVDLDLGGADAEPRPFDLNSTAPSHYTGSSGPLLAGGVYGGRDMSQTGAPSLLSSGSRYPESEGGYGGSSTGGGLAGLGAGAMSAKQREAQGIPHPGAPGMFAVANPDEAEEDAAANIVVHRDGGRLPPGTEIPPTYDSIPADGR